MSAAFDGLDNVSLGDPDPSGLKKHHFNDRMFCDDCGADAIGLRGWGKDAMKCPFSRPGLKGPGERTNA